MSVTAATQPSIEASIVMGAIPRPPLRSHLHNPVLAYENGDEFMDFWQQGVTRIAWAASVRAGDRGVDPQREDQGRGLLGRKRSAPTRRPGQADHDLRHRIDRLPPKAVAVIAAGTCATYGGIHAMAGNPTGAMGLADYLGWNWRSAAGLPIVNVPGCPVQPDNMTETLLYLLYQVAGLAPMIPLDQELRPTWLFGKTVHEGCDRGSYYEQADFAHEYGSPKCLVRIGCWGPVVNCNVPKRGWMAGIGGCPNVGGICIGCTMPGFPDKFMPFMDEPPGGILSSTLIGTYGKLIRRLRGITNTTVNKEPKWRHTRPELTTGYLPTSYGPKSPEVGSARRGSIRFGRSRVPGPCPTARHSTPPSDVIRLSRPRDPSPRMEPDSCRRSPSPQRKAQSDTSQLVEMSWDPITRIVGSLGIYTKIDFANRQVVECHSTSSIFRGYSIFMQGKDPRDAHFITSRICGICGDNHATCACYAQNMAFGIRPPAMAEWIVNLGEAAGSTCSTTTSSRTNLVGVALTASRWSKEVSNPGVWEKALHADAPHFGDHPYKTIADIMRVAQPRSTGEFYREALQMSRVTRRDVLPDGGTTRSSLNPLPRRGGHRPHPTAALHRLHHPADAKYVEFMKEGRAERARRPLRLLLRGAPGVRGGRTSPSPVGVLGVVERPEGVRLPVPPHERVGEGHVRDPRRDRRRQDGDEQPSGHQPRHPHPPRLVVLRRLGPIRAEVLHHATTRWATRSTSRHPLETDDDRPGPRSATSRATYTGSCRPRWLDTNTGEEPPGGWTPAEALSRGSGRRRQLARPGRHRLHQGDRPQRQDLPAQDRDDAGGGVRVEGSPGGATPWSAIRARTYFQAYAAAAALYFTERAMEELHAGRTRTWTDFTVPDDAIGCGFHEAVRGVLSHHVVIRDGKIANYHPYPPTPWNATPPRRPTHPPAPTRMPSRTTADLRGEWPGQVQGRSTSCGPSAGDPCLPCSVHNVYGRR